MNDLTRKSFLAFLVTCLAVTPALAQWDANPNGVPYRVYRPSGAFSPINNNYANVLDYGAVGDGVTDDTLAFKAAIATQRKVFVPGWKTNGYVVSNIVLTNGGGIISDGGRLIFPASASGWMILCGAPVVLTGGIYPTNPLPSNIQIEGLELDGGGSSIPTSLGTRHGVWVDPYGTNNVLKNCFVHGFTGYGILIQAYRPYSVAAGPFQALDNASLKFSGCEAQYNGIGISLRTGVAPAPYSDTDKYLCEYLTASTLAASFNWVGIDISGGNNNVGSSQFARNTINVRLLQVDANQNAGHGSLVGCSINHAGTAGILATNLDVGFVFNGCNLFEAPIYLTNCYGVTIAGGIINNTSPITIAGGGANSVVWNMWHNGEPTITVVNSQAQIFGNRAVSGAMGTQPFLQSSNFVVSANGAIYNTATGFGPILIGTQTNGVAGLWATANDGIVVLSAGSSGFWVNKLDGSGTVLQVNNSGNLTATGNLTSVGTNSMTGVSTNVVGATVKGQLPVNIGGVTYYIDVKK